MYISINNKLLKEKDAKISVLDHGLLLGDGIFETLKTKDGKIYKFNEHYARLKNSARQAFLPIPISKTELKKQIEKTIKANKLKQARIRVTITRGIGPAGLSIKCKDQSVIIVTNPLKHVSFGKGAKIITYNLERDLPAIKSLSFLPSVVAKVQASKKQALDAILIDKKGYAREGSFSNVFLVKNNRLITPKNNILKGITRDEIIQLAKKEKITINEKDFMKKDLINADEIFITFTTGGIVPIIKINNKNMKIGRITKKLIELY